MNDEDMELDDDEIVALYEDDSDTLTPEDLFKMILIDKKTKERISIQLEDEEGDEIELADMLRELVNYVKDKLEEGSNQLTDQIMPLISQSLVSGMSRMMGLQPTAFFISNPNMRITLTYMMTISFILYKMIQVKKLVINTVKEDITDEEIEEMERKSKASSAASMSAILGMDPRKTLQQMLETGDITKEDIEDILGPIGNSDEQKRS